MVQLNWTVFMVNVLLLTKSVRGEEKTFLSFNAKMLRDRSDVELRKPHIISALIAENVDVACVQEGFHAVDIMDIQNAVSGTYPYVYSPIHSPDGTTFYGGWGKACGGYSWSWLLALGCLSYYCGTESTTSGIIECDEANDCNGWNTLSQSCITCLGTTSDIYMCVPAFWRNSRKVNVPGLVLFRKTPITNGKYTPFFPEEQANKKGYISANIAGFPTEVVCTHLTPAYNDPYYEPDTQYLLSWKNENLEETKKLINDLASQEKAVVLGDFNFGPNISDSNITPEFEDSYIKMTESFTSPYVHDVTLTTNTPGYGNSIIDHIFIRGFDASEFERVMDGTFGVNNIYYSDHYGVRGKLQF